MKTILLILVTLILGSTALRAQSSKMEREFGNPIITDSASTIIIPTVYDASVFTSSKLYLWGNYYSNLIFYNFKTDSSYKLFAEDTYIYSLDQSRHYNSGFYTNDRAGLTSNVILYRIANVDKNKNGKIDNDDPILLYASGIHGENLKLLTSPDENVSELLVYEKQHMALVKMQRDKNGDNNFNDKDNDYYYIKLDLATLKFGKKIELK